MKIKNKAVIKNNIRNKNKNYLYIGIIYINY